MRALSHVGQRLRAARDTWKQLSREDARLLLAMLSVVLCTWVFLEVANAVAARRTQTIDERLIRIFRDPLDPSMPRGPDWLPGVVRDITSLGSAPVLALFVLAVAGFLVARRQHHALALLLVTTLG